jgi:hypothetical protein
MRRISLAALAVACLAISGVQMPLPRPAAAADDPYAGVEVLRGLFAGHDYNRDGRISPRELNAFAVLVFVSTDADADGRVSLAEFLAWDPGFASLARERGKVEAFEAAKREVFEARDRNGDGGVDETEMTVNAAHEFVLADKDRDGSLSPDEYAVGFPILVVIARAIR